MEERRQYKRHEVKDSHATVISCILKRGADEIPLEILNISSIGMNCIMPPDLLSQITRDSILHLIFTLDAEKSVHAEGQIVWKDEFNNPSVPQTVGMHLVFFDPSNELEFQYALKKL